MPNIKDLELNEAALTFEPLDGRLLQNIQLKVFRIYVLIGQRSLPILEALLNRSNELEQISLHFLEPYGIAFRMELFIESICRFKRIKYLEIRSRYSTGLGGDWLSRLVRELQHLEKIHVECVSALHEVHDALNMANNMLKKAYFRVSTTVASAPKVFSSQMAAIDAIRRERGIELCVEINVMYDSGNERVGKVSELELHIEYMYYLNIYVYLFHLRFIVFILFLFEQTLTEEWKHQYRMFRNWSTITLNTLEKK